MPAAERLPAIASLSLRFRRRRLERFMREFGVTPRTTVLDIGGAAGFWRLVGNPPRVTLLNMPRAAEETEGGERRVAGSALALPFRDGAFDIVFSNSVIEHVGGESNQRRFAEEAVRVGRGYWIQTPNRWFPVEQHLLTPFIHWLPASCQRALVPRATVWGAFARVPHDRREYFLRHYLDEVRLLDAAELMRLFPGAGLIRERAGVWTKSLIAYRKPARME
jgi:hypothetical protein